jgi:septum formation protein
MTVSSDRSALNLILASASPRRKDLLTDLGVRFQVLPSSVEETPLEGETPAAQVRRLAEAKARDVARTVSGSWVLGADTIVVIDGEILGKPETIEDAVRMLSTLANRIHTVYTGYALVDPTPPHHARVRHVSSSVHIRALTREEIEAYVGSGEPMDKAGAYAIQGIGAAIVQAVTGSYTNVVGLPLCEVAQDLKELGIFDFLKVNGKRDPA